MPTFRRARVSRDGFGRYDDETSEASAPRSTFEWPHAFTRLRSTDAGVAGRALIVTVMFAMLFRPARRLGIVQLWAGIAVFTAGLFVLRGAR